MKRPSYLQQIASPAPGRQPGVAVLSPPRLLFRPGATDIVELEARPVSPAVGLPRPAHPAASPTAGAMPRGAQPIPSRPATAGPAQPTPQPTAATFDLPPPRLAAAPRPAPAGALRAGTGRPMSVMRSTTALPPEAARIAPRAPTPVAPVPGAMASASGAAARPSSVPLPAAAVQNSRAPASDGARALTPPHAGAAAPSPVPPRPSAANAPDRDLGPVAGPVTPRAPPPDVHEAPADPAPPPPTRGIAATVLPAITPSAPPPRPPLPPPAQPQTGGLHIGALEVRVVAPAPVAANHRAAPRGSVARTASSGAGRIARGFGVFGLGQT